MHDVMADKVRLAFLPTPLHELKNLRLTPLMPKMYIKRDDCTGLALGGNKTRKLEYLMADALKQEADTIITAGAIQSNHCRQTAAAAAMHGIGCTLLLGGDKTGNVNGNLLLDELFGAEIVYTGTERLGESIASVYDTLKRENRKPYTVPYGGSNPVGVLGYVAAMRELMDQLDSMGITIDHIVLPTSSCGTQAGLIVGSKLYGFKGKIHGISVDKTLSETSVLEEMVSDLCNRTAKSIEAGFVVSRNEIDIDHSYTGGGYGIPGAMEVQALNLLGAREGIILDPVYTARAMGGLIDMIQNNMFSPDETILFWHTGGVPSLFAYSEFLTGIESLDSPGYSIT